MRTLLGVITLLLIPAPGFPVPAAPGSVQDAAKDGVIALKGARIVTVSKGDIEDGTILIADGRIKAIGRGLEIPAGAETIELPKGSVAVPGFIDAHSHLASVFEIDESTESLTPQVRAVEGFSSTHADVRRATASGVTLVALAPGNGNLVAGRVGLVRINGRRLDRMIVSDSAALKLSLGDEALRRDREPTSRTGALRMLRDALRDPRGEISKSLIDRREPAIIHARLAADITRAVELKETFNLKAALVHADEATQVLERIRNGDVSVIFGPLTVSDKRAKLETPAKLAAAGVRLAFCTDAPASAEDQLRVTAAIAVKYGLDPKAALRALTLDAAALLGVGDRFGSLEEGREADVVVYGGDPLSLASPVELVVVEGRIVHRKPKR